MKFKNIYATIALSATIALLAACGDGGDSTTQDASSTDTSAFTQPATTDQSGSQTKMESPHGDMSESPHGDFASIQQGMSPHGDSPIQKRDLEYQEAPESRPTLSDDVAIKEYTIEQVVLNIPEDWEATPEDQLSMMRAAEYKIPPAEEGARGAEMVVYYFGPGQGGPVDMNVNRWIGQVTQPADAEPTLFKQDVNELTVTEVRVNGTLKPSMMGASFNEPMPDSSLYGIVIEGAPNGNIFIKITGSKEAIDQALPAIGTLVESVKVAE